MLMELTRASSATTMVQLVTQLKDQERGERGRRKQGEGRVRDEKGHNRGEG